MGKKKKKIGQKKKSVGVNVQKQGLTGVPELSRSNAHIPRDFFPLPRQQEFSLGPLQPPPPGPPGPPPPPPPPIPPIPNADHSLCYMIDIFVYEWIKEHRPDVKTAPKYQDLKTLPIPFPPHLAAQDTFEQEFPRVLIQLFPVLEDLRIWLGKARTDTGIPLSFGEMLEWLCVSIDYFLFDILNLERGILGHGPPPPQPPDTGGPLPPRSPSPPPRTPTPPPDNNVPPPPPPPAPPPGPPTVLDLQQRQREQQICNPKRDETSQPVPTTQLDPSQPDSGSPQMDGKHQPIQQPPMPDFLVETIIQKFNTLDLYSDPFPMFFNQKTMNLMNDIMNEMNQVKDRNEKYAQIRGLVTNTPITEEDIKYAAFEFNYVTKVMDDMLLLFIQRIILDENLKARYINRLKFFIKHFNVWVDILQYWLYELGPLIKVIDIFYLKCVKLLQSMELIDKIIGINSNK